MTVDAECAALIALPERPGRFRPAINVEVLFQSDNRVLAYVTEVRLLALLLLRPMKWGRIKSLPASRCNRRRSLGVAFSKPPCLASSPMP